MQHDSHAVYFYAQLAGPIRTSSAPPPASLLDRAFVTSQFIPHKVSDSSTAPIRPSPKPQQSPLQPPPPVTPKPVPTIPAPAPPPPQPAPPSMPQQTAPPSAPAGKYGPFVTGHAKCASGTHFHSTCRPEANYWSSPTGSCYSAPSTNFKYSYATSWPCSKCSYCSQPAHKARGPFGTTSAIATSPWISCI